MARITAKTPEAKAQKIIERDLCTLTGPELLRKYGKPGSAAAGALFDITGKPPGDFFDHNPFWYYLLQVWFDDEMGRSLLYEPMHKDQMAQMILDLTLGKYDAYDGVHLEWPRRAMKSTFLSAACDWVAKRHKLVDGMDVTQFYIHNVLDEAKERIGLGKEKNRNHPYIKRYFHDDFYIDPEVEWDTQAYFNWKCKKPGGTATGYSVRALSVSGKKAGKGANYMWLDDTEDEDSKDSETVRKNVLSGYLQLRKLSAPPWKREVFVNTPYHLNGLTLTKREMKNKNGECRYHVMVTPGLDDKNNPLFPTIPSLTVEALERERDNEIGSTGNDFFWWLQYMLEPRMTGIQGFEWDWFRTLPVAEFRKDYANRPHMGVIFVDSAWKGDENQGKGDDTAIAAVNIYRRGDTFEYVICDLAVSNEWVSNEGADEICRMAKRWGIWHVAPEMSGEKTFIGTLRDAYRRNGTHLTVIELGGWSKKAKEARISSMAGSARLGSVFILDGLPHLAKLRQQVEDYPQLAHEDVIDCLANAWAGEIAEKWLPMDMYDDQRDRLASDRPAIPITRYTGLEMPVH